MREGRWWQLPRIGWCTAGFVTRAGRGRCRSDPDGQRPAAARADGTNLARARSGRKSCGFSWASRGPLVVFSYAAPSLFTRPHACLFLMPSLSSPPAASGTRHSLPLPEEPNLWSVLMCLTLDYACGVYVLSSPVILPLSQSMRGKQSAGEAVKRIRGGDMARFQARGQRRVVGKQIRSPALSLCFWALPSWHTWAALGHDHIHSSRCVHVSCSVYANLIRAVSRVPHKTFALLLC